MPEPWSDEEREQIEILSGSDASTYAARYPNGEWADRGVALNEELGLSPVARFRWRQLEEPYAVLPEVTVVYLLTSIPTLVREEVHGHA